MIPEGSRSPFRKETDQASERSRMVIVGQMDSTLAVLQVRQTLEKMNRLRDNVRTFAIHAGTINAISSELDSLLLLQEADRLSQKLGAARNDYRSAESNIDSLSRSLPSAVPSRGGMSPAAQWVPQLRARVPPLQSRFGRSYSGGSFVSHSDALVWRRSMRREKECCKSRAHSEAPGRRSVAEA